MYISLVLATGAIIMLFGIFILIIGLGLGDDIEAHPWQLLWLIPLIGILFISAKTTKCPDFDEVAKTSTEKWHTVYTNSINANVTVTADNITLNPKKPVTSGDKEKLFTASDLIPFNLSNRTVTITATNKHDSTSKEAKLTQENFIEKWPKGTTPDKSNGRITKIEYRSTPIALKWFGMNVEKNLTTKHESLLNTKVQTNHRLSNFLARTRKETTWKKIL